MTFFWTVGVAVALSGKFKLCLYANNSGDIQVGVRSSKIAGAGIESSPLDKMLLYWAFGIFVFSIVGFAIVIFTEVIEFLLSTIL